MLQGLACLAEELQVDMQRLWLRNLGRDDRLIGTALCPSVRSYVIEASGPGDKIFGAPAIQAQEEKDSPAPLAVQH